VATATHGHANVYVIAAPGADVARTVLPLIRDAGSEFVRAYSAGSGSIFVVQPDGYLGFVSPALDTDGLVAHLHATFA